MEITTSRESGELLRVAHQRPARLRSGQKVTAAKNASAAISVNISGRLPAGHRRLGEPLPVQVTQPDGGIATRRFTASRGQVADGGRSQTDGIPDVGIRHAAGGQVADSGSPCLHGPQITENRNSLSTAFRNGVPLKSSHMTIGERIRRARTSGPAGKVSRKDLAEAAGLAYSTLADIENGNSQSTTALHKIAKRLRIRVEWLETGKGAMEAPEDTVPEEGWADIIGVRQAAALGEGAVVDEYAETHKLKFRAESLRRKRLRADRLAVLYGKGDSMVPTIKNGDAILFDTSDVEPKDGKIYVISYEGALMAKRLLELGGRWFIESDNKDDPKWRKPVAVDETRHFEIHGRVRWIGSWED